MIGFEVTELNQLPGQLQVTCPNCKQTIKLVTYAQAVLVGCGSCHKIFRTREKTWIAQKQFQAKNEKIPVIPLRKKGYLAGVLYSVVGFISYKEENYAYYWREYVLFNPVHGYAFLSEYDGHWNLFRFISDYTHGKSHIYSFHYNEHKFNLYNKYKVDVLYAEGEFFWDVLDESGQYTEYVAPPYIMTRVISRNEISWMLGEYVEPKEIKGAFTIKTEMPLRSGVGASEPFSSGFSFESLKIVVLVTTLLLIFCHALFVMSSKEEVLADASFNLPDSYISNNLTPLAGPTFTIKENWAGTSNLEFNLYAPVNNNWLSTGITLVNTRTHQEYDFEMGVEYYSGYSDGESWSEGSQKKDKLISALPSGTYQTIIQPYRDNFSTISNFSFTIVQDVPVWSNFWIVLALVLFFPAIQWIRNYSFEKRRWMNSDYSPYSE